MYNGLVKAVGPAIKVQADNTYIVGIDGGGLVSTGYVTYYNLSTTSTEFTGDARVVSNTNSSAINSKGAVRFNRKKSQDTIGLNGIASSNSDCDQSSCMGRKYGTHVFSKSGYGIYGNGTIDVSIGGAEGNFKVENAGTYKVKLVLNADGKTGTITLVAA